LRLRFVRATARELSACKALFDRGFVMMMQGCGMGMMVMMWLAGLLGLALLVTLIVLLWVVIGRLRRDSSWPAGGSGTGRQ